MLVGHNSGLQDVAVRLAGQGDAPLITSMEEKYPTGALAVLDFHTDTWDAVTPGSGHLVDFIKPRDLESGDEEDLVAKPRADLLSPLTGPQVPVSNPAGRDAYLHLRPCVPTCLSDKTPLKIRQGI